MTFEEYSELKKKIEYHMNLYYNEDAPEISDYEYDLLMQELKKAEKENPSFVTADSPSQKVGGRAKREAGVKVTHDVPMLSIEDVFTKEDVVSWINKVHERFPDCRFSVEAKIDGLSMSLRYEREGDRLVLKLAETRGDGFIGEDVTLNAREIDDVKEEIDLPFSDLELRSLGEMITPDRKTKSTFLIADVPDTNIKAFWESIAERGNPLQLGMWEDGGGSAGHFPAEKTIRMTEGSLHFDNGGSIMDYFIFYVTDEAVKKITVEAFGQSHTIIPDENGFGYISNTELMSDRLRQKKPPEEICTGEAFDANGKLLHRIEAPGFRLQDGTLLTYYGWVPVTE